MPKKRTIEAEDICRFSLINDVAIAPDEKKIAYTVENVSEDKRKYYSRIYMADVANGETRQYTFGEINDRGLVWSPDGRFIAFVSTRDKKTGIYVMPAEGGGERLVITKDGSFSNLRWTPDGKTLVYQFRYNDSHQEKDEKKKKEAPLFRHIDRLFYRLDGLGWLPKDRFHIWKVEVASGEDKQLTKGKYDEVQPDVAPDGKSIVFVSNRSKDPDMAPMLDDLYIISINGGAMKKVPTPKGPVAAPVFSPDGKKIAYLGHDEPESAWSAAVSRIWTVGIGGRPAAKDLLPKFDRQCYDQTIGDLGEGFGLFMPTWSKDKKRIYFGAADNGSTHIFYVPAKGGLPTRVTKKPCHVKAFHLNGKKRQIAAVISTLATPGELHLMPAVYNGDGKAKVVAAPNKELLAGINMPKIKEVAFKGYDGTGLQGWLVTPPDFRKTKKYPGILEIHGGPTAQYGYTFYHEMLYLAAQGFVVFYTNPRGGGGMGRTWTETIIGDWGTIDYQDCMAAADYLESLPYVNAKKVGVTGGSYGGYMTNWMVGQTNRFKAAVTQRSVVDLRSMLGTTDMGVDMKYEFLAYPWDDPETYQRCSPYSYIKNIKTPLLIIHSEQDLRCNIEQAEQLFVTMKLMGKKVEMVRFPEEPHGLSRHGRPDRRLARLDWIRKWFKRYLR